MAAFAAGDAAVVEFHAHGGIAFEQHTAHQGPGEDGQVAAFLYRVQITLGGAEAQPAVLGGVEDRRPFGVLGVVGRVARDADLLHRVEVDVGQFRHTTDLGDDDGAVLAVGV